MQHDNQHQNNQQAPDAYSQQRMFQQQQQYMQNVGMGQTQLPGDMMNLMNQMQYPGTTPGTTAQNQPNMSNQQQLLGMQPNIGQFMPAQHNLGQNHQQMGNQDQQVMAGGQHGFGGDMAGQQVGDQNFDDDSNDGGQKGKRRSKNDVEGRDFKCNYCVKTYLSYPALYTHIKQKHSKGPDGEQRAPPTSGRGRGRPRKNPYHRTDPQKDAYFQLTERAGKTDPLTSFDELFQNLIKDDGKYKSVEDYPLYQHLKQFSSKEQKPGKKEGKSSKSKADNAEKKEDQGAKKEQEEEKHDLGENGAEAANGKSDDEWKTRGWKKNYDRLSDQEKVEMLVDEIFAYYLYEVSTKVQDTFYKTVLQFVILFRECLEEIGWKKRKENETDPEAQKEIDEEKSFCANNSAEHAPEICNEFVTVYMEKHKGKIEIVKCDQIDLTINLCHWLFEKQFTCSKLTMIT